MTELQMLSTYLTGRLNQLIAIVNLKGTTAQALTAIRNGVPVAGDDLNKLYALSVGLTNSINIINGLLLSNDTTLDELQEVVDFIKANRADLDALTISNIAGLQDALDAKLALAGGSMFGDIEMGGSKVGFGAGADISANSQAVEIHGENGVIAVLASGKNWQFRSTDLLTTAFGYQAMLKWAALSANRTVTFPNKSITVAGLDDVAAAIAALVDSSPGALDTLNELAAALGDDPNFATTVTNSIATKLPLAGGMMSGNIELNGNSVKNNTGAVLLESSAGLFNLRNLLSTFIGVLNVSGLTANRTITFQDKDHTVAGLDDIPLQFAATDTITPIAAVVHDIVVFSPTNNPISEIIVTLGTPQVSGAIFTVDILKNGVSILSTKATIDNTEYTTLTAVTPMVISDLTRSKGDRFTVQTTQIGNGTAKQLGVMIL